MSSASLPSETMASKGSLQPARGTRDLLGEDCRRHHAVIQRAQDQALLAGYEAMETPIFEDTNVFYRLGESSDIVTKETYTFADRGGHSLTLRPEGTAPVARALISNGLTQEMPGRYFYAGPMFRYERPQKGRYRQLHQVGVELFGIPSYHGDVEVLQVAHGFLKALGLMDKVQLEINTLGDAESRAAYREKLVDYFKDHRSQLSEDSQRRLEQNPLRILDSKDEGDRALLVNAPLYGDSLTQASKDFFQNVLVSLDALEIPYVHNPRLVRGLDYYCHTAFEFVSTHLGAQGTVLAGGRYDGLVKDLGGPDVPGVGWAAGVDRLALLLDEAMDPRRPIVILPLGDLAERAAFVLARELRVQGLSTQCLYTGNLGKRFKKADKANAAVAIVLGEDELAQGKAQVRLLDQGSESLVDLGAIGAYITDHIPLKKD